MGRPKRIQDDELLAAAREVFVAEGFAASTRRIAARAGISEAVIYQRHGTKADLFFAAMTPPVVDLDELFSSQGDEADARAQLERVTLGLLDYFRELVPLLMPLMAHRQFQLEDSLERHPDSPLATIRTGLVRWIEEQRAAGRLATEDPGAAALALFAALHSIAGFEVLGAHDGHFDEGLILAMVGCLWDGLRPTAS